MTTTGQRLIALRKKKKVSQAAAGEAAGVSGQQIGRYEADKDQPGGVVLVKLARFFDCTTAYLSCESEDPAGSNDLPPDWEDVVRRIMVDMSPGELEEAIELYRAYRKNRKG